jgi:hypothetical protein
VPLVVDVRTCAATTPAAFGITAKKTSDYSGSSTFTLKSTADKQVNVVGQCALAFATQPKDAKKDTTITSVAFDALGAAVKVIVVDANPAPGIATFFTSATPIVLTAFNANVANPLLSGTTSVAPTSGAASFAPKIGVSAAGYTFTATSGDFPSSSPISAAFEIVDAQASCASGASCTTTTPPSSNGTTASASFGAGPATTNLKLSVNAAGAPVFECNGYPKGNSQVSQFSFSGDLGGDRVGTFSVTIPNASWFVIIYQVCWASPVDFYTKWGKLASAGTPDIGDGTPKPGSPGQTLKVGLLPNCKKWWWNDHWDWDDHWGFPNPTIETLPCITSRSYNWSTRSVTIEVKTTGADPWRY